MINKSRIIFILLISIIYSLNSFAQTSQHVFNYGFGNDILNTSDGGFIINGEIKTNTNDRNFLMKFDSSGEIKWLKLYRDIIEFFSMGTQVLEVPNEGFVSVGNMYNDTLSNYEITLLKCDSSGAIIWTKSYGNPSVDDYAKSIIAVNDGYLIAGFNSGNTMGGQDFLIIHTDTAGNIIQSKVFGTNLNDRSIKLLKYNGGYIFAGNYEVDSTGENDICLLYLDSTLNLLRTTRFLMTGNQELHDVIVKNNGGLLLAGSTQFQQTYIKPFFINLSDSGTIQWCKEFSAFSALAREMIEYHNQFITVGSLPSSSGNDSFILSFDQSGNVLSEISGDSTGCENSSVAISNDTLLITGYYTKYNSGNASIYQSKYLLNDTACNYFSRIDSMFDIPVTVDSIPFQQSSPILSETNALVIYLDVPIKDSILCDYSNYINELNFRNPLSIFPNPSDGKITIDNNLRLNDYSLSIYNQIGKLITVYKVKKNVDTINLESLPDGLYYLILSDEKIITAGKLIIQH